MSLNATNWCELTAETVVNRLIPLGLYLNSPECAIICTRCRYALQPAGEAVSKHLWEKHEVPLNQRVGLNSFVRSLHLPDPNVLPSRPDGSAPHPHLLTQPGFRCIHCRYTTTSRNLLQRHLGTSHKIGIEKGYKSGDHGRQRVMLQCWTANGCRSYWEVIPALPTMTSGNTAQVSPSRRQRLKSLLGAEQNRSKTRDNVMATTTALPEFISQSNWMRRTGWTSTFANADLDLIFRLSALPKTKDFSHGQPRRILRDVFIDPANEHRLSIICDAVDNFMDRCEDTLQHSDHILRRWLRSQRRDHPQQAPFEIPGRRATSIRYRNLWKRTLCYFLRIHLLQGQLSYESVALRLTDVQREEIQHLWHQSLEALHSEGTDSSHVAGNNNQSQRSDRQLFPNLIADTTTTNSTQTCETLLEPQEVNEASSYDTSEEEDASTYSDVYDHESGFSEFEDIECLNRKDRFFLQNECPSQTGDSKITEGVGRFSEFLCKEKFVDGKSSSALLVYFSGVLGICADGCTFERPNNYTPKLSALVYCARLSILEASVPRYAHPLLGWDARPSVDYVRLFNHTRRRYLCDDSSSPTGELLSLRAYGRAMRRSDGPSFRVHWTENSETVRWDGGSLSMSQFRGLGRSASSSARGMLDKLLCGLRPSIDLGTLKDRISEYAEGYSFIQDPANRIGTPDEEYCTRACLDPTDGLMSKDGWNAKAVHAFLKGENALLTTLMLMVFLRSGQAARSTELLSIECSNSRSSSRGVYVYQGSMMLVTRHSKARKSTNKEFHVARFLNEEDSQLLALYLVYIRPLAAVLQRECYGLSTERRLLFCSSSDPNTPWGAKNLSSALSKLTIEACGSSFGIQVYRQLSIAITERHLNQSSRPFDRFDERDTNNNEIAFAWQSGYRPVQRGLSYGVDAAFPDTLQPALLRVYIRVSHEWHRFLAQRESASVATPVGYASKSYTQPATSTKGVRKRISLEDDSAEAPSKSRRFSSEATKSRPSPSHKHVASDVVPQDTKRLKFVNSESPHVVLHTHDEFGAIKQRELRTCESQAESVKGKMRHHGMSFFDSQAHRNAADCLHYNLQYRVLICKEHGYAIASWKRHLTDYHTFNKTEIKEATRCFQGLEVVRPEHALVPPPNGPPVEFLQPSRGGFECRGSPTDPCGQLSISRPSMAQHCNKIHGWRSSPRAHSNWNEVKVQSFCTTSGKQRWFVVNE
jgi:hypothetical protein